MLEGLGRLVMVDWSAVILPIPMVILGSPDCSNYRWHSTIWRIHDEASKNCDIRSNRSSTKSNSRH